MKKLTKALSFLLTLTMVVGLMPGMSLTAYAATFVSYKVASVNATTHAVTFDDASCETYTVVTADTTTFEDGKWYVVSNSVTVSSRITVTGTVNLILCDGATLTAGKGITVNSSNTLNIYAQSAGTGELSAGNDGNAASIGGGARYQSGGTVNIHGGNITAIGGYYAAGIGGALDGGNGEVNIYGGNVTAQGNNFAAGIGGYSKKSGGTVSIYGGTVNASGSINGVGIGIGGTEPGSCIVNIYGGDVIASSVKQSGIQGTVNIGGGTVTANGGTYDGLSGYSGTTVACNGISGTVTISGGTVTATGGSVTGTVDSYGGNIYASSGIGGTVTISGGTVVATGGNATADIENYGGNIYVCDGISGIVTINGGTVTATGGSHTGSTTNHRGTTEKGEGFGGSLTLGTGMYLYGGTSANPESDLSNYRAGAGDYTGDRYVYMTVNNVVPHIHSFTYTATGATITAACTASCDITEGLALTISAPTELTYDGSAKAATLSTGYNTTAFPGEYMIKYYQGANEVEAANVKAAGDYTAKVTVGEAIASVDFTIAKANPSYTVPGSLTAIYGKTLADVTLPDGWTWKDNSASVGNVGTNTFKANFTPTDTENYNTVENVDVKVNVSKGNGAEALTPDITAWTSDSIYVTAVSGQEYVIVKTGETPDWSKAVTPDEEGLEFDGLTPATEYTVYTRVKETENTLASNAKKTDVLTSLNGWETQGEPKTGETITIIPDPENTEGLTWQWYYAEENDEGAVVKSEVIEGATSSSYAVKEADVGKYLYYVISKGGKELEQGYSGPVKITINPTVALEDWAYGEKPNTPVVTGNTGNGAVSFTYAEKGSDEPESETVPTLPGSYTVYAYIEESDNYAYGYAEADFTITKGTPAVTAPTARTLTYNGFAQELVNAGSVSGGTLYYAVTTENKAPVENLYTTSIPSKTDAGTYYVWYKIVGDSNHNDTEPVCITVKISKINPTYTIPTGLTATYGQTLANVTLPENWAWADSTQSVGNVGTNSFSAIFTPTDTTNYNTVTVNASVSVSKAAGSISYAAASVNETYGNAAFTNELTKTGDGTVTYATSNEAVVTVAADGKVTIVGVGEATVTATVADGANYAYEVKSASYRVSVAKAAGSTATISTDNMSWSSDCVNIEGTAGQEYIIVPKGTVITAESWQSSLKPDAERENWVFFTELTPATEYVIYTRTAETDTHNAGEPVNANVHTDLKSIGMDFDSDLLGAEFKVKTEPETEELTYKWYRDTVTDNGEGGKNHDLTEIADATGSSYTFRDADVGKHIAVKIFRGESEVGEANTDFAIAAAATVTFDSKGGREAEPQTGLSYNSKVTEPEGITRSGYILAGWYADEEYDIKWDFDADTVKWADTTLYAKWTPIYIAPTVTVSVSGEDETVNVTVQVSGDTATITSADVDKVLNAEEVGTVTVDVSALKNGVTEVVIPGAMVEKIADAVADESSTADGLEIKLPTGTITFDAEAVAAISEQADGKDLRLNLEDIGESKLSAAQKDTVKDMDVQEVLDAYMTSNGKRISDFKGGKATVTVSYELKDGQVGRGIVVWYVADNGEKTEVPAAYSNKEVSFTVEHFSNYVIAYDAERAASCPKDDTCPISEFADADTNAWYHDGVHFVLENKLMSGYGNGKFGPADYTSRAMVAQILWNLEGKPASGYEMNYTDVAEDAWYANAIRWATEKGVVTGYGDGKFGPDDNITREQLAAIIYRYAQSKGQGFTGMWMFNLDYEDAASVSDWASEAMHWMVMKGIIKGQTDKTLAPKSFASRAEIATMIMRYAVLEK